MENQFWVYVTNVGDSALLVAISLILTMLLWALESFRAAFLFARALLLCLLALLLLKLVFISCGKIWGLGIHSPSGHTGFSLIVYGSIATVLMKQVSVEGKVLIAYLTAAIIAAISYSRVLLGAHSLIEVLIGGTAAAIMLSTFVVPYSKLKHPPIKLGLFVGMIVAGAVLSYGYHAPAETVVHMAASFLKVKFDICN